MKKQSNIACSLFLLAGWLVLMALPAWIPAQTNQDAQASVAAPEEELRDPFWPVGYYPPNVKAPVAKVDPKQPPPPPPKPVKPTWPQIKLKGITSDLKGGYMAILDSGIVVEGQIHEQHQGNLIYRWKIDKITATGVSYTELDVQRAGK